MMIKQRFELKITGVLLELLGYIQAVIVGEHVFLTVLSGIQQTHILPIVLYGSNPQKSLLKSQLVKQ